MSRRGIPNKKHMPEDMKRNVILSFRIRKSEQALINKVIGDNEAVRLFLLKSVEKLKHERE